MKSLTLILSLLLAAPVLAGMGTSGAHDLDALLARAEAGYDLGAQDAVVLVHDTAVTVADNGDIATRVHTMVWIGTGQGIRHYADLRVPWNSATSTLDVELLRTWRDGRWWPGATRISDTAVVHTLPHALRNAYDYGAMRETMLLHDGVELPCLLETAYTITETGRPLAAGVFVFPQPDPALQVSFSVTLPPGSELAHEPRNGAGPARQDGATWSWSLPDLGPEAWPGTADPSDHEPAVVWSSAPEVAALAAPWLTAFEAAVAEFDPADLQPGLDDAVAAAAGGPAGLRAAVAHLGGAVRTVHYDASSWRFAPRSASRVWATAYGHALDRAVLHTAVLRGLGHAVTPHFVRRAGASPSVAVQTGALVLEVVPHGAVAAAPLYLDPETDTLHAAAAYPGLVPAARPDEAFQPDAPADRLEVTISLQPGQDGAWQGSCRVEADGGLAPGTAHAAAGDLDDRIGLIVASVLPDAETRAVSVQQATSGRFAAECAVALPAGDEADQTFVLGSPRGGYPGALPHDVHLADAKRTAPVRLAGPVRQRIIVRFATDGRTAVHVPADRIDQRDAGRFAVSTTATPGWLTYRRELELEGPFPGTAWPDLRALLLEESDAANGTVVLRRDTP